MNKYSILFLVLISCTTTKYLASKKTEEYRFLTWYISNNNVKNIADINKPIEPVDIGKLIPKEIITLSREDSLFVSSSKAVFTQSKLDSINIINISTQVKNGFYPAFYKFTNLHFVKKENKIIFAYEYFCGDLCGYSLVEVYEKTGISYRKIFSKRIWIS